MPKTNCSIRAHVTSVQAVHEWLELGLGTDEHNVGESKPAQWQQRLRQAWCGQPSQRYDGSRSEGGAGSRSSHFQSTNRTGITALLYPWQNHGNQGCAVAAAHKNASWAFNIIEVKRRSWQDLCGCSCQNSCLESAASVRIANDPSSLSPESLAEGSHGALILHRHPLSLYRYTSMYGVSSLPTWFLSLPFFFAPGPTARCQTFRVASEPRRPPG